MMKALSALLVLLKNDGLSSHLTRAAHDIERVLCTVYDDRIGGELGYFQRG